MILRVALRVSDWNAARYNFYLYTLMQLVQHSEISKHTPKLIILSTVNLTTSPLPGNQLAKKATVLTSQTVSPLISALQMSKGRQPGYTRLGSVLSQWFNSVVGLSAHTLYVRSDLPMSTLTTRTWSVICKHIGHLVKKSIVGAHYVILSLALSKLSSF